jgi:hypothetical protein
MVSRVRGIPGCYPRSQDRDLRHPQLRLQKRAGVIYASTGCEVDASELATIRSSRTVDLRRIVISFIESHSVVRDYRWRSTEHGSPFR